MGIYEIRVRGRLDQHWATWFTGLTLAYDGDCTVLRGSLADEAALHGVLAKVRDLNVRLLEVRAIEADVPATKAGMPAPVVDAPGEHADGAADVSAADSGGESDATTTHEAGRRTRSSRKHPP